MKKILFLIIILLLITPLFTGCGPDSSEVVDSPGEEKITEPGRAEKGLVDEDEDEEVQDLRDEAQEVTEEMQGVTEDTRDVTRAASTEYSEYFSPFTGEPIDRPLFARAIMVSIENSPQAIPQSGLEDAAIIYEFLVEGGITRFLALYWPDLPARLGPIRSLRPYQIKLAEEYNALLLHAGASPEGFNLLAQNSVEHLDQIFRGSYYWRSSDRNPPHNLYTGDFKINSYLERITGVEYNSRFSFQQVSFIKTDAPRRKKIEINYWGGYRVIYDFNEAENLYYRYLYNIGIPHSSGGEQLTARNIIVQYVSTRVIDDLGRLKMELEGEGKALIFRDGIVINGSWKKAGNQWTIFYDEEGKEVQLNSGQTWIQIVPENASVIYEE